MGVDLNIWSNHNLEWGNSSIELINQLEEMLATKIKIYDFKEKSGIGDTELLGDFEYFIYKNNLNSNFADGNLSLRLNYRNLFAIDFYKSAMLLIPIGYYTKWHKWKSLVSKNYLSEEQNINKWNEYHSNWIESNSFMKSLIVQLGGNKVYYINDASFELKEDLFYTGANFDLIKDELNEIGEGQHIKELITKSIDYDSKNYWFYDIITTKTINQFKGQLQTLLIERNAKDDNDLSINLIWDKLIKILVQEQELTNRILMDGNYEIVTFISEVMEEVFFKTRDKLFLKNILKWESRFPELKLKYNIEPLLKWSHET